MRKLINLRFKRGEKQFIAVTKFDTTWADDKSLRLSLKQHSIKLL